MCVGKHSKGGSLYVNKPKYFRIMVGAIGSSTALWPGLTRELSNQIRNSATILTLFMTPGQCSDLLYNHSLPKYNLLSTYYVTDILGTRVISVNKREK